MTLGNSKSPAQRGYVLLILLLLMALMAIAAAVIVPTISWEVRRDKEEEMIHRGVQYRRAIREFTKKRGRYPNTVDELVGGDGLRFLRKHFTDPITGKEFKLLHASDVASAFGPSNPGNVQPNQNEAASQDSADDNSGVPAVPPDPSSAQPPANGTSQLTQPGLPKTGSAANPSGQATSPTFGGGPFIGVASASTKETIRIFDKKNHYNQWLFFYDPGYDRGHDTWGPTSLLRSLPNPSLNGGQPTNAQPGQPAQPEQPAQPPPQQ